MVSVILDSTEEKWSVNENSKGLEVYEGDTLVTEIEDAFFSDFTDEWGKINESELHAAIKEEIENKILNSL